MGPSLMSELCENFEHLTFEGMVWARHSDSDWKVSEVGSMSWVSSTTFPTT